MSDAERLILVGKVQGSFGVKGEVRIRAFTEDPKALVGFRDLLRKDGAAGLTLVSGRVAKDGVIGRAREIETKEQADALRGLELYVPRSRLPAVEDEDEFYMTDLIGLAVVGLDGEAMGKVRSVQDFGAGDILEIEPEGGGQTWMLPFTRACAPVVSIAEGRITAVRPKEIE